MVDKKIRDLRIINIFDDEKFIDPAITLFESVYPNLCEYYVVSNTKTFKYVKSSLAKAVALETDLDYQKIADYINNSEEKTAVFLHALNLRKQRISNLLNNKSVKVWFGWGYELYNSWKPLKHRIFEPNTYSFVYRNYSFKSKLINKLFYRNNLYKFSGKGLEIYKTPFYRAVQKMDIGLCLKTEFPNLLALNNKLVYTDLTYTSLENMLGNQIETNVLGEQNILVGNSATATNNHIEVFKKLSKLNLGDKKVIVPLSYGDTDDYLAFILKQGKALLGNNFKPIMDYLSLEDYNKLVSSCGCVIFNHIRQQAVSNIVTMGYFGAKVILNEKGETYKFYKSIGLNIYGFKELNQSIIDSTLSQENFEANQQILKTNYSLEVVQKMTKDFFQFVASHPKFKANV